MPIEFTVTPNMHIKLGGSDIPDTLADSLSEIEVENHLHLPDAATMRFHLGAIAGIGMNVLDSDMNDYLSNGEEVEIYHSRAPGQEALIFDGEVTSVELEYGSQGPDSPIFAVIQAYDRSHRLHRGRKTETFLNASFSDIVRNVAGDHSLRAVVDSTPGVHEYIVQSNQTDWEFLWQLADRIGYQVYVSGRELHFENTQTTHGQPIALTWGEELFQFRIRSTTAFQVPEVTVRGWDWKKKEAIVGKATEGEGSPKLGGNRTGTQQAASAYGNSQVAVVDLPVETQGGADALAKSLANAIAGGYVYAEGVTSQGMGELLPGKVVEIKSIGNHFGGQYYVTSTTHRYTGWDGYTTSFIVGGRGSHTLGELLDNPSKINSASSIQGVVVGIVTNNRDPDGHSRIKVKFPWLADNTESNWARMSVPSAGNGRGIQWLPEVNDEVLVSFEHGDIHRPYIIGSLWNGEDKSPEDNSNAIGSDGKVNLRIIKSRAGHMIILDDSDGNEKIIVRDKTGNNEIVIDSTRNSLSVKVDRDIAIEATGNVSIDCQNLNINAAQNCQIRGVQTSIEGSAMAELKGGLVKIN